MQWPWHFRWPWRKARPPQQAMSLRHLYSRYQRQQQMWMYVIVSSAFLMLLFLPLSLLSMASFWTLAIPVLGIAFAIAQSRRCKDIIHTLRQALVTQQQIEKANAEGHARETDRAQAGATPAAGGEGGAQEAAAPQAVRQKPADIPADGGNSPGGNGRRAQKE